MSTNQDTPSLPLLWSSIQRKMTPGKTLEDGRYEVLEVSEKRLVVKRTETGSTVVVTRRLLEKTWARLEAGAIIPTRGIDYTVAKEKTVVAVLGRSIKAWKASTPEEEILIGKATGYQIA